MAMITKTARVTDENVRRVDHVVKCLTNLSHSKMRGLFDHGCISVNGRPCANTSIPLKAGDEVTVCYDPQQGYREKRKPWIDPNFSIIYEDRHLIVVNKSANVLTVATDFGDPVTLVGCISHYLKHAGHKQSAYVVHRLDRGVSGLLVFAKSADVRRTLQDQFKQHKPERLYFAIVVGTLSSSTGAFRSYLDTGDNLDQFSTRDLAKGKLAVTHYRVLKKLRDTTLVEIRLETGRRNQIRVHFADEGHPVLGDQRYGRYKGLLEHWPANRLALHAISLGFEHPVSGEPLVFTSELPDPMRRFIEK